MDVTLFNQLNDRTPYDYDWSRNYIHGQSEKLAQLGKTYYGRKNKEILEGTKNMVELYEPIKHNPEKCQGSAQTFLIYHHLYYHYKLKQYHIRNIKTRPPC